MRPEHYDVVVIGGGQAGLAIGSTSTEQGRLAGREYRLRRLSTRRDTRPGGQPVAVAPAGPAGG